MSQKVDPEVSRSATGQGDRADRGAILTAVAWSRLASGVVRGLNHAVGNRLHALEALRSVPQPGEPVDAEFLAMLGDAVEGCRHLLDQARSMVLLDDEQACAGTVGDPLRQALQLLDHHVRAPEREAEVRVDGEPPAVLAAPTGLTHAFLLILVAIACRLEGEPSAEATLEVREEAGGVRVQFRASGVANATDVELALDAAAWLLRATAPAPQLSWSHDAAATEVVVVLPSLASSRRLQKAVSAS